MFCWSIGDQKQPQDRPEYSQTTCNARQSSCNTPQSSARPVDSRSGARETNLAEPSQTHSVGAEIEMQRASKGRNHGEGCPFTIRLGVSGASKAFPPTENVLHGYLVSVRSHPKHFFGIFERWLGPNAQTSRSPGKLPLPLSRRACHQSELGL